jgi:hypothetical protein
MRMGDLRRPRERRDPGGWPEVAKVVLPSSTYPLAPRCSVRTAGLACLRRRGPCEHRLSGLHRYGPPSGAAKSTLLLVACRGAALGLLRATLAAWSLVAHRSPQRLGNETATRTPPLKGHSDAATHARLALGGPNWESMSTASIRDWSPTRARCTTLVLADDPGRPVTRHHHIIATVTTVVLPKYMRNVAKASSAYPFLGPRQAIGVQARPAKPYT